MTIGNLEEEFYTELAKRKYGVRGSVRIPYTAELPLQISIKDIVVDELNFADNEGGVTVDTNYHIVFDLDKLITLADFSCPEYKVSKTSKLHGAKNESITSIMDRWLDDVLRDAERELVKRTRPVNVLNVSKDSDGDPILGLTVLGLNEGYIYVDIEDRFIYVIYDEDEGNYLITNGVERDKDDDIDRIAIYCDKLPDLIRNLKALFRCDEGEEDVYYLSTYGYKVHDEREFLTRLAMPFISNCTLRWTVQGTSEYVVAATLEESNNKYTIDLRCRKYGYTITYTADNSNNLFGVFGTETNSIDIFPIEEDFYEITDVRRRAFNAVKHLKDYIEGRRGCK